MVTFILNFMIKGCLVEKLDKVEEPKFGQMAQCMKAGGKTIKQMAKADLFTLMAISMMDFGKMIKLMNMAYIAI